MKTVILIILYLICAFITAGIIVWFDGDASDMELCAWTMFRCLLGWYLIALIELSVFIFLMLGKIPSFIAGVIEGLTKKGSVREC